MDQIGIDEMLKALSKKPDKRNIKINTENHNRDYLQIKYIQDILDKIFPIRDEEVINEYIRGNTLHITLRLTTPLGKRDGMGSYVIRVGRDGEPIGPSIIDGRRVARSMALKNAAQSLGRALGRDLNRDGEETAYKSNFVN